MSFSKNYYQKNKEECKKRAFEWKRNNPEKQKEIYKKYYQKHREKIRERKKKHYQENIEKEREKGRIYYNRHKKERQEYHRKWKEKNPERIRLLRRRRRYMKKGAKGSHTLKQWEELKKKFNYKCVICKKKKRLTEDHITPLSKGGTNYIENIQPLCRSCNSKKSNKI